MKLCLGVGPLPIHPQHLEVMKNPDEWTLVDFFVDDPLIKKWDCRTLTTVGNGTCEEIYASHLLEHFPHVEVPGILSLWQRKLATGGTLTINVPDLEWAARELIKLANGYLLDGYYHTFEGEHGLQSIFYGSQSHEGEYHKCGFTIESLENLLRRAGFTHITVRKEVDAHQMGVLIATASK